ncbi:MAG: hypothetical protein ABR866_21485 [Candidatus Korobacteraceae bacterium]|jgi:hypothetical protein
MADLGNGPITADSTDDALCKRALFLGYKIGGPVNLIGYILQLERRIAVLEKSRLPAHLQNLEQR